MNATETLLAIEQIKALKSRYFRALDFKEWDTYGELFTPDAVIDFSDQPELWAHGDEPANPQDWIFVGGVSAAEAIEPLFEGVITVHHGHDPEITVDSPQTALGVWSLYDRLEFADEIFHGYGHYREEYQRIGGEWLISRLVLTRKRCVWESKAAAAAGEGK